MWRRIGIYAYRHICTKADTTIITNTVRFIRIIGFIRIIRVISTISWYLNCKTHQDHRAYLHYPDHQHYKPKPYFFTSGQEASEGSWPPGAEKWPFYKRPSIRIGHFWATARAAEIGARTTFYSLDKRPKKS